MDLGIVYHIEDARQFWSELEDILQVSASSTLTRLDAAVQNFVSFCSTYHEQYLQTPVQLEHACSLLLDSEIFNFHSERLSSLVITDALSNTDPHAQLILHNVLLLYGRRHASFFRSSKKWSDLIPLLMDHILLVDVECDAYSSGSSNAWRGGIGVPIEARLRQLAVRMLYEVCRVQKFDLARLNVFNDVFIDRLFELVEVTRDMQDETLNYCLIKLIVSLNEQFMVSALQANKENVNKDNPKPENRVIQILMRRLGSSKTFGENLIFMLNRADHSAEDRCMQLLVLKILYLLFTTQGTQEYFYTNDLHVLVDVFIRELVDLDEDSESLRHTYLRVLHPLLTHTQLRSVPYKRQQILRTLESLVAHAEIREINPTTKRLVERCLGASWAVEVKKERDASKASVSSHSGSMSSMSASTYSPDHVPANLQSMSQLLHPVSAPHPLKNEWYMKYSKSVDVITAKEGVGKSGHYDDVGVKKGKSKPTLGVLDLRRGSNESSLSLLSIAGAAPAPAAAAAHHHHHPPASPTASLPVPSSRSRLHGHSDARRPEPKRHSADTYPLTTTHGHGSGRAGVVHEDEDDAAPVPATPIFNDPPRLQLYDEPADDDASGSSTSTPTATPAQIPPTRPQTVLAPAPAAPAPAPAPASGPSPPRYRPAPAPPAKRRKPPAVPSRSTKAVAAAAAVVRDAGGTITTIASSKRVVMPVPSPLSRVS